MKLTTKTAILAFALSAAAAPIENGKRQLFGGGTGTGDTLPSISFPTSGFALPTGTSSGDLGSLGGLTAGSSGLSASLTKRQFSGTGDLGSLTTGLSGSGLSGLGSGTSSESPGSLGGLTGGSSSQGGLSSGGLSSLGSSSTSGLGSLEGATSRSTSLKERQFSSGLGSLGSLGTSTRSSSIGGFDLGSLTGSATISATGTTASGSGSASSGGCKAVSLLFARGTGEFNTMGTVVGPPLATALASALGDDKVSAEGVDYPADAGGNGNMGASGGPAMASQAQAILSSCPDTKLVLSGYSQGGMVVHNALSDQGLDGSKVAAIVAFGDPFNGQDFKGVDASKVKEFCGSADGLCSAGGTTGSGSHLSYGGDAEAAASFIVSVVGA